MSNLQGKVVLISAASSDFGQEAALLFARAGCRVALVARRVLDLAKRPRRSLIIPWWFRILTTLDMLFPVLVDWISYAFSKKNHKLD